MLLAQTKCELPFSFLQVFCQGIVGVDAAAADPLPPPLQLNRQPQRGLPRPPAAVSGGGDNHLVRLHRGLLLRRGRDRLVFWNGRRGRCHQGVHIQSRLQAGRLPVARLRHLGTLLHPGLLVSLHHWGNCAHDLPEDSRSLCAAQDGAKLALRSLESDRDCLGVDVCVHLRLLSWPVSQTARDGMRAAGVVSDISGLVSKAMVARTPSSVPPEGLKLHTWAAVMLSCSLLLLQPSSSQHTTFDVIFLWVQAGQFY